MKAQEEINHFSGAVLIARNDSILLKNGYGLANREWNIPNTVNTKFQIASNTKQFTAACILQLEEQGKLSLNDTLGKYIPGFEYGDTVTLHMLLTHSSGVQDYFHLKEFDYKSTVISKDSMIALMKTKLFDFLPGWDLNYSNTNYFLLGLIIEKASGESFESFLSQHILKPVGMMNTGIVRYDTVLLNRAGGYKFTPHGIENAFNEAYRSDLMFGCGSMYSTVEDMYKWDRALYGNSILGEASKAKMYFPYGFSIAQAKNNADPANTMGGVMDPFWYHLGYGLFADTFATHRRIFTRGGTSGFHSTIYRFINDNCFVAVLQNNEENPDRIAEALSAIMFGADFILPYKHESYKLNPEILKRYTGVWTGNIYDDKWTIEIFIRDGKLYRRTEGYPDLELIPESETKFFYSDGQDKVFEFVPSENGEITQAWFIINGIKFRRDKIR
jgi:CubicO group peptidase (beta-lactamase class C family)